MLALEAGETPAQKEALDAVSRGLAALGGPLPPHQREQLKALSPEDLAIARKVTSLGGAKALKLVVWLVVAFFAFFLVLPVIAGVFDLAVPSLSVASGGRFFDIPMPAISKPTF